MMDRLGLGVDVLTARNPRLIYVSISGFGQTGPWREWPAYDSVVQAASGMVSIIGRPGEEPVKPGVPIADPAAGLYAFGAIGAALQGRSTTGRGTHLEIAMFDATVTLLEGAALSYLATGVTPPRIGNAHYSIAPFDTFACAGGSIMICAANDNLFGRLCAVVERPDLAANPRFRTNGDRLREREAFKTEIEATLRRQEPDHWLKALQAAGVPCGPINDVPAAVDSARTSARRMVIEAGGLPPPGNPIKAAGYPDPLERPAARARARARARRGRRAVRAEFTGPATG
ncbi:hypothetical protein FRAHR75_530005 [Frankia sp. Hr75.2]|nr:hypothetical protein FRAHR75_530005 [Frankia sp. Hr75.2]